MALCNHLLHRAGIADPHHGPTQAALTAELHGVKGALGFGLHLGVKDPTNAQGKTGKANKSFPFLKMNRSN